MNGVYEYKGYTYKPSNDVEDDNIKIFHDVETPEGKLVHFDWSPYDTPSFENFQLWIDLGLPERIDCGPLNEKDLITIGKRELNKINKALHGISY